MQKFILFVACLLLFPLFTFSQTSFGGESVEWDPTGKRWFVSDNGTSIVQRDSMANLSYFGTGLDASHGMEVMGNTLFACNGDDIYGYDLTTEMQVMSVNIPGAVFLNGLTNNGVDMLYTTDFSDKAIYSIDVSDLNNPVVDTLAQNLTRTPNGIIYNGSNNRLIFVTWGANASIMALDLGTLQTSTLTTTTFSNIDGIDEDNDGNYFISTWTPDRITMYDSLFSGPGMTITAPGVNNPADICYAKEIDTLAIPNGNNTVTFVGFGPVTGVEEDLATVSGLGVYPNPASEQSYVHFELAQAQNVRLTVTDLQGRQVAQLLNEPLSVGEHAVLLAGMKIEAGLYLVQLESEEGTAVFRMLMQ